MTRTAVIVCAAGVASTFLARTLRAQVAAHDLDWQIEPLAADQLAARVGEVSIVFVGHHLGDGFAGVQNTLGGSAALAHLLDSDDHTLAARQALTLLLALDSLPPVSSHLDSKKEAPHG